MIDKDLASSLLATELGVETLVLATDVDAVYDRYGTDEQRLIVRATPAALRDHDFPAGSMRELLDGHAGTQVVAEGPGIEYTERGAGRERAA